MPFYYIFSGFRKYKPDRVRKGMKAGDQPTFAVDVLETPEVRLVFSLGTVTSRSFSVSKNLTRRRFLLATAALLLPL